MAVIAANSVTSTSPANAASGASASANGDVFAAMLDQLAQDLTNGMAVVPADAATGGDSGAGVQDDATAATSTAGDASPCAAISDPVLAQLLAAQQAAGNMPAQNTPATAQPDTDDAIDADADKSASATAPASTDPQDAANGTSPAASETVWPLAADASDDAASSEPRSGDTSPRPDNHVAGKEQHHGQTEAAPDPSQAGVLSSDPSQVANAAAQTVAAPQPPNTAGQAANAAPVPAPADPAGTEAAAATNQAASSVVAAGTISKPGKPTAGVASSDSSKNEGRSTKASALAGASDVTRRGFASEPAVRAASLAVLTYGGDADMPAAISPPTTPQQQFIAANPATLATPQQPVADAMPAQQAAAPAHPVQPAQPDPSVSIATVITGASPTQTATAATPAHLAAQIQVTQHTPDINALAVNIAAKSEDGQRHFDIRLDPAELGRVDVRLTVDDAGKAQATLSVEKPQTLELLQKDSSHLERALKDAGLDLSQNGLNFSLKGQQQQQQAQDHAPFARGQRLAARAVAAIAETAPILSSNGVSASDTRLDIRV